MANDTNMFAQGTRFSEKTALHCLSVQESEMFGKVVRRYENCAGIKSITSRDGEELGKRVFFRAGTKTLMVWCPLGQDWTDKEFWVRYAGAEMFCVTRIDKDGKPYKDPKLLTMRALNDDYEGIVAPEAEEPQEPDAE
jgi:hypothetical protein